MLTYYIAYFSVVLLKQHNYKAAYRKEFTLVHSSTGRVHGGGDITALLKQADNICINSHRKQSEGTGSGPSYKSSKPNNNDSIPSAGLHLLKVP